MIKEESSRKKEKEKEKEKDQPLCYECKKPRYFRTNYPLLKKTFKRIKKKAIIVTWSNNDEFSAEEKN